ncbi:MAG: TetR family transcriptional regulator, partial [Oscillibacter sp.]|nr:TetR family transcriptional regulator [Oscillibacter sp.]
MLKNPEDRRARRSRKLLKESLLELMKRKSFSDISVRDVTDAADMNRATFYLHYSGTAELLQSVEEDLLSELQALVDAHMQETFAVGSVAPV